MLATISSHSFSRTLHSPVFDRVFTERLRHGRHPEKHAPKEIHWGSLGMAGIYYGLGLLIHKKLPITPATTARLLPADWKIWTKVGLSILSIRKLNQAFDWHPRPWQGALEAVALMSPMTLGLTLKSLGQVAVMAPLVAGIVEAADKTQSLLAPPLKEEFNIPPLIPRLALSIGFALVGIKVFPPLYKAVAKTGMLGKAARQEILGKSGNAVLGTAMVTCARGCTPGSIVCLTELGEIVTSIGNWFHNGSKPETRNS